MKKKIDFTIQGRRADIGDIIIYRLLPNHYTKTVGPFVFLDHIAPVEHKNKKEDKKSGTGPHPHRGIATLTYLLNGEGEHFDSRGHHAKVHSGGVQWMKAGNGIIHDESFEVDSQTGSMLTHGFQFWINLPAKVKAQTPEYVSVQATEVPIQVLEGNAGWIKVIAGEYQHLVSKIPAYTEQFLYHIHLEGGKTFSLDTVKDLEYAVFLPEHQVTVNDSRSNPGDFIRFDSREGGIIELKNEHTEAVDVLLFGGERYTEPIVMQGPFVMNSHQGIAQAYDDFYEGKYGTINYKREINSIVKQ